MNTRGKKIEPFAPLQVWVVALLMFIILNATLYFFSKWVLNGNRRVYEDRNVQTLRMMHQRMMKYPKERYVVIIGSSVIKNAIWCSEEFAAYQRDHPQKINVYKITEAGYQLEYFTNEMHLFDSLLAYKPDIILIEDNLLFVDLKRLKTGMLAKTYYDFRFTIRSGLMPLPKPKEVCFSPDDKNIDDSTRINIDRRIVSAEETTYFEGILKSFQKKGIQLGLLRSPRPAAFRAAIRKHGSYHTLMSLRKDYIKKYGLVYVPFCLDMSWNEFVDEGHMNRTGQNRYSRWLVQMLDEYFKQDGHTLNCH